MSTHTPGAVLLGSDFKALAVARSLGRRGIPIVIVDNLPRSAWFSRHVTKRFKWGGAMYGTAFTTYLLDLVDRESLAGWVLFPAQDEALELVARSSNQLSRVYRLATQPWDVLKWAHDKRLLNVVADGAGVSHPRTWYPESEDALPAMPIDFPAIVKPTMSIDMQYEIGRKALPVAGIEELVQAYRYALEIVPAEDIMIQEVVSGGIQYSVAAFCEQGSILSSMTARRTRQYPIDYGLSSSFVEAVEVPHLLEPTRRLLRRLGITGMVEVEFIEDRRDGEPKLIDVNARPFGWHALCIASGLDLPWMQYGLAVGRRPARAVPSYGRRWIRLLTDIPAAAQLIRAGHVSPADYLRSFRGEKVFSVLDRDDPLPAVGDMAVAASRVVRAMSRRRGPRSVAARPGANRLANQPAHTADVPPV